MDAVYAPLTGGYCIVLSDGRAALLTSSDSKFHPNVSSLTIFPFYFQHSEPSRSLGSDAQGRHLHRRQPQVPVADLRLQKVGRFLKMPVATSFSGDLVGFHLDDTNGSLVQTFRISVSVKDGPGKGFFNLLITSYRNREPYRPMHPCQCSPEWSGSDRYLGHFCNDADDFFNGGEDEWGGGERR